MDTDLVYYRRRSAEETAAATAASDPKVRQIHLELARKYDERVVDYESDTSRTPLRLVSTA